MKTKFFLIFLAVVLHLSSSVLNADEPPHKQDIPLNQIINGDDDYDNRSLVMVPVECSYFSMMNSIVTTVYSDLGDVFLTVTNCSTGNVWYDSFDSALEPQTMLTLSGEPGIYRIIFLTELGSVYEGTFTLQ